jgi:hypothetical protein
VFAELLANGDFFSSHWALVLGIGLAFFLLQLALSTRIYLRSAQHDRILVDLCEDLEEGGDGRGELHSLPRSFTWIRWVLSIFPARSSSPPGNFTRDEVLQELDTRIASSSDYLLLQRMGVMAPLLGVVLTVLGFYWLQVGESDEQSLQSILLVVTPLVSGVGTGAVLALVNQALLHGAGVRVERLRMTARTWFDAAIWSHVGLDTQAATVKAIAAIERFAHSVGESADRQAASTGRMEATTESMRGAASQFGAVVQSFGAEMKGVPQTLFDLRNATAVSAEALKELILVGGRAVANLDVSVAAFRTTIDREFADAAKLHLRSSQALAESVLHIGDTTESLKSGSEELKQIAQSSAASTEQINDSLRQHLVGANRKLHDAVQTLAGQIAGLSEVASGLSASVEATAEEFDKAAGSTREALAGTAKGLSDAGKQLRGTIESDLAPSQRTMHDAAASFAGSARQLSEFIEQGLGPATRELAALHHTMAGLGDAVHSIQQFSHARADIDRLTETLARAAEITDAIAALPEQLREVLEQTVRRSGASANSRLGIRTWLGGRPR